MTVSLQRFKPSGFRVYLPARPETAVALLAARPDLRVVSAGAMFDGRGLQYGALDGHSKRYVPSRFPNRGATISVRRGVATAAGGWAAPTGSTVAWQGYPALVRSGRNVASRTIDAERVGRCAAGIDRDGMLVIASATRMSMYDFAEALIAAGVVEAAYSDGGGSTLFLKRDGGGPWVRQADSNLTSRPLASFLAAVDPMEL